MTHATIRLLPEVEALAAQAMSALLSSSEPEVETNTHCKNCDYLEHCWTSRSKHDVVYLPGVRPKEVVDLRALGYHTIDAIPDDYGLTDKRLRSRTAIQTGLPQVSPGLGEALNRIKFPAAFIDYETAGAVFPMHAGTRPYQSICFQWSAHLIASEESIPEHRDFLAVDDRDPREDFCRTLWEAIRDCQSIVHYTGFEISQMRAMAAEGIPLAQELLDLISERSVDLHRIVDENVTMQEFMGKTSIKVVLPALVPWMSYAELAIADGQAAASAYRMLIDERTSSAKRAQIRDALLAYCRQDTLAMIEISRALQSLSAGS